MLTLQELSDAIAGALFYRNTHIGPDFKELRKDLETNPFFEQQSKGWTFLLCTHEKGLSFEQLFDEVAKCYEQHQYALSTEETPELTPEPEEVLEDIKRCLQETTMRVEL